MPLSAFALVPPAEGDRPVEIDVRGSEGVPKGTELRQPTAAQLRAIDSLQQRVSAPLVVQYNGLTATPRHLLSHDGYLSAPSTKPAEVIAREFLHQWRAIWQFEQADLDNLRLKSRATIPDTGTTILLFEQQVNGVSVHKGEVLVNVSSTGQIVSVGGENFPKMQVTNSFTLPPVAAVNSAAEKLGFAARGGTFSPDSVGTTQVLRTFGDLPQEFTEAERFRSGDAASDDIIVQKVIFPLGDQGRAAYKLTLTTPHHDGIMWENIVDAATGEVLRRISLTAFQAGGGVGPGRQGTLRPDVQDMLESLNPAGTSRGKVFDAMPTALSGPLGFGRSTAPGVAPLYAPDTVTTAPGRGFRLGLVTGRIESPLIYSLGFGQVLRGFPDALNPTPESPFGWFYLPTDTAGAEITSANLNRDATRAFGYNIHSTARGRNPAENSPDGDGLQPFSASLTPLPVARMLADGRNLTSVFQSRYTEGNNVLVADDHQNDNESTHGIKGFSANGQFTGDRFNFINSYEYGGVDAASGTFPPSTFPDVAPGTVTLFYMINFLHDYLYSIGFTELMWNFQQDNFGKGGAGRDAVSGQVQDGSGINNANFGTPSDGSRPRMQMFLWTEASVRRADGDFDFDVVAHELYHGVSNRSAGKGETGCLGVTLVGESGGQGEGWSDFLAESVADDDGTGEYVTGNFDRGIRRLPKTNFRYSYAAINQRGLFRRDQQLPPDPETGVGTGSVPFAVHRTGEIWSAALWDMRELLIMKDPAGVFYDGTRRLGTGTNYFVGYRQLRSVDAAHPIDYRAAFNTQDPGTIKPAEAVVRPRLLAEEVASRGNRTGPLATAVKNGGRLADTLVLRGLQLSPCNPSYVDSRDSILLADRELTGGENQAVIWRAFASHGIGLNARSTASSSTDPGSQSAPLVVEDFSVPAGVTQCEQLGPLPAPGFTATNTTANTATLTIVPQAGAARYVISRGTSAAGPFRTLADIPATETSFSDNNGGEGLDLGQTYFYQVRATRNAQCVSSGTTESVTITVGVPVDPAPVFLGVDQISDSRRGNQLVISWRPATSAKPNAQLVYDVFRVDHVNHNRYQPNVSEPPPSFTPSATNRVAQGLTGTSFVDTGLMLNRVYYYIVQARDAQNGKKDTNNTGNTVTRFAAPTIDCFVGSPFALETFESASASSRFAPPLVESGNDPQQEIMAWQRVTNISLGANVRTSMLYGPDFSPPGSGGAQSDFVTVMGPITLTPTSIMDFDHLFNTEATFDGGVIEISVGTPDFNSAVYPDNVTTFDLGDYMIEGGYNDNLNGELGGVFLSALQGRRAFTGSKGLHHTRIALRNFAPGGVHNPGGAPVYIRFRMTSDVGTSVGVDTGWYIDNLSIRSMGTSGGTLQVQQVFSRKTHAQAGTFDVPLAPSGPATVEPRSGGSGGEHTLVFRFGQAITNVGSVTSSSGTVGRTGPGENDNELVVRLSGVPNAEVVTVTLGNVTDACGNTAAAVVASMGVLVGDTNGDGVVNAGDVQQTRSRSGQVVVPTNFRSDVNIDGAINSGDALVVRNNSGNSIAP